MSDSAVNFSTSCAFGDHTWSRHTRAKSKQDISLKRMMSWQDLVMLTYRLVITIELL